MATLEATFRRPFAEQLEAFRRKLSLPSRRWDDLIRHGHDHGFIVAGATKADLVADLRQAVDSAIENGESLGKFRQRFRETVARRGWTGWTGEGSKAGQAWRTRVIYKTNLDTSYAAGRWQQMTDPELMQDRPYWQYVHNTVENPRIQHRRWDGLVLPAAHPWFNTRYPPNGFGCNCGVRTLSRRDLARLGKSGPDTPPDDGTWEHVHPETGEVTEVPNGVQYGFDYAPGQAAAHEAAMAARLNRLPGVEAPVARRHVQELVAAPLFQRFVQGDMDGDYPVGVTPGELREALGAESPLVLLAQESLRAKRERQSEIDVADYRRVQQLLDEGEITPRPGDPGRLITLVVAGVAYRAEIGIREGQAYLISLTRDDEDPS